MFTFLIEKNQIMNIALSQTLKNGSWSYKILLLLLAISFMLLFIYYTIWQNAYTLVDEMQEKVAIEASPELYKEAINYATKTLASELDIELENYDIGFDEYQSILEAAKDKFGDCQQYRLYVLTPTLYTCYTCVTKPKVLLESGQTFKIGQTCNGQKKRYGTSLPEAGLKYFVEYEGNVFEVLVIEYLKLLMYQHSFERKKVLHKNLLSDEEMHLPPGNKILR